MGISNNTPLTFVFFEKVLATRMQILLSANEKKGVSSNAKVNNKFLKVVKTAVKKTTNV